MKNLFEKIFNLSLDFCSKKNSKVTFLKTTKLPSISESTNSKPVTSFGGSSISFILSETGNIGIQKANNNIKIIAHKKLGVTTPKREIILAGSEKLSILYKCELSISLIFE